jgi:hypothetical protein
VEHVNPPVMFELGGRNLALLLNSRAINLLREKAGLNGSGSLDIGGYFRDFGKLATLVWAVTQNPGNGVPEERPTLEWVEDWFSAHDMERFSECVIPLVPEHMRTIKSANPQTAPGETAQAPAEPPSTDGPPPSSDSESIPTTNPS